MHKSNTELFLIRSSLSVQMWRSAPGGPDLHVVTAFTSPELQFGHYLNNMWQNSISANLAARVWHKIASKWSDAPQVTANTQTGRQENSDEGATIHFPTVGDSTPRAWILNGWFHFLLVLRYFPFTNMMTSNNCCRKKRTQEEKELLLSVPHSQWASKIQFQPRRKNTEVEERIKK